MFINAALLHPDPPHCSNGRVVGVVLDAGSMVEASVVGGSAVGAIVLVGSAVGGTKVVDLVVGGTVVAGSELAVGEAVVTSIVGSAA